MNEGYWLRDEEVRSLAIQEVLAELTRAQGLWPRMNSPHEGYAVLLEEVEELWREVRRSQKAPEYLPAMRREAVQAAAMALRFIIDVCKMPEEGRR